MTVKHQRQRIREAVAARLVCKTSAGDRVFETRVVPFRRLELPAIAVYALSESSEDQQSAPRELKRTLSLTIDAAVKSGDNVDDAMDAIALEVERAMHADETFGGLASDSVLASTDIEVFEEADQFVGLVKLQYEVTYYTAAPDAADVVLDDLESIYTETQLRNAADAVEDRITFEE
jgi:hypothetical protein